MIALLLVDLAEVQKLLPNHMTIVLIAERSDEPLFIILSYIKVTFAIFCQVPKFDNETFPINCWPVVVFKITVIVSSLTTVWWLRCSAITCRQTYCRSYTWNRNNVYMSPLHAYPTIKKTKLFACIAYFDSGVKWWMQVSAIVTYPHKISELLQVATGDVWW